VLTPPVVSGLRSVRKVSNKSDFGTRHFTPALGPQLSASTSSDATARALQFGPIIKRVLDVVVAAVGLILFSPILSIMALAIIFDSNGQSSAATPVTATVIRPFVFSHFDALRRRISMAPSAHNVAAHA
jgi:lipopolysaccharide/colanic/teichoic acid biosynthesis glycosyltransferase